jgi:hypothetical protein
MTYPGLHPQDRPVVLACLRARRRQLALVRRMEAEQANLRGFKLESHKYTCAHLRRETRLQLKAIREVLHALFDEQLTREPPAQW